MLKSLSPIKELGFPAEDIEHIFEPFFRSKEKQALRRKGTGIPLAITKAIMQAHGGTVLVRSQLGSGSTFILQFPDELLVERKCIVYDISGRLNLKLCAI